MVDVLAFYPVDFEKFNKIKNTAAGQVTILIQHNSSRKSLLLK